MEAEIEPAEEEPFFDALSTPPPTADSPPSSSAALRRPKPSNPPPPPPPSLSLSSFSPNFLNNRANLGQRLSKGIFFAVLVFWILVICLVSALFIGNVLSGLVVEEPVDFSVDLSFDFTRSSPKAEVFFSNRIGSSGRRFRSTVYLTLPESDYNRKLGIFQVRVEFLTSEGKTLSSSSRPCMLRFKSGPIRILEIILKSVLVMIDFSSETQTISLSMGSFKEGASAPTAAAMVVLEPRPGQRLGAGLPELYSAGLRLESELSLARRLLWSWRRTFFVGTVIFLFNLELLLLLVCCTPLLLPGYFRRTSS